MCQIQQDDHRNRIKETSNNSTELNEDIVIDATLLEKEI